MATVPTYITFAAGSILTAAQLNSNVRDGGNFWLTVKPVCRVRQTVAQSIPNSAYTAVTWDAEDYDNDGMHSTVTNTSRLTAVTAGRYIFLASIGFAVNGTGVRVIDIRTTQPGGATTRVGGSDLTPAQATTNQDMVTSWSDFMSVGDYVETMLFQNAGGALNTVTVSNNSATATMHAYWIHNA